jgi:hypothetical protein
MGNAFACDCFEIPSHKTEFKKSKAIFIGEVIKIQPRGAEVRETLSDDIQNELGDLITLKVLKSWKGQSKTQVIWTSDMFELCVHWKFKIGEKFLVYATKRHGLLIGADFCSRTRPLEMANAEQIREFKELDRF